MGGGLVLSGVIKAYGAVPVLRGVSLDVPRGEFHTLLGPSGSGKTTLLKIVAGFTVADAGSVTLAGAGITHTLPERRNIGVVFQNYALFPHMTVAQNVGFGLRMRRVARAERHRRVADVLALVRMSGFEARRPAELSGGQQQRVALARALVIEPRLLLLDEPLSALDRKVRQEVREELKRIQATTGVTTVMVTHDQEEALFLSDRVLVLDAGVVRQGGAPAELYRNPVDAFVAGFFGPVQVLTLAADCAGGMLRLGEQAFAPMPELSAALAAAGPASTVQLAVRPEQLAVELARAGPVPADALRGEVAAVEFGGAVVTVRVRVEGTLLAVLALSPDVSSQAGWGQGAPVWLRIRQARVLPATATAQA